MKGFLLLSAIAVLFSGVSPIRSSTLQEASLKRILSPSNETDCTLRLSFQIGKTHYWRNGLIKGALPDSTPAMGTSPEIRNKRTFLIIRPITAEVGARLDYWRKGTPENPSGQDQVRMTTRDGKVIDLWIGNPKAKINGIPMDIDPTDATGKVAPYIKGKGYTMLPLRFVGDNLGASVNWIAGTQTAELIFTDEDCLKKCCSYELKPLTQLVMCPGEQKLAEFELRNVCTSRKATYTLTPRSQVMSVEPSQVTLEPGGRAILRAGLSMPETVADLAEFSIGVSIDCGKTDMTTFKAVFSSTNCRKACGWICGCLSDVQDFGDLALIIFDEECDGLGQAEQRSPKGLKDLMLGLTFAEYYGRYGSGACADLCLGEDGLVTAWKARPSRKVCCQERALVTIELVDCEREMAIGTDPEGGTWVLDLAGKKLCDSFVPGQCYDVGGTEIKPVGTGIVTSKLLKVDNATAIACAGKVLCGVIEARNCKADPPRLMLRLEDGSTSEIAVCDTRVRALSGKTVECPELADGSCVHASGYEKDGLFQALSLEQMPCPCGRDFLSFDCRITSVSQDSRGELTVQARRDCNGDSQYLTAPVTLGDDFGKFKNLLAYSWTGSYVGLVVDGNRILRWIPRKGCQDCNPEEMASILSATHLGQRGWLIACRNSDGRVVALRSANDLEHGGARLSTYRGTAKLVVDGLGTVKSWRIIDGPCCDGQPAPVPEKPAILVSGQSTEVQSDPRSQTSAIIPVKTIEATLGASIGATPYPWQMIERHGARWIEAPQGMKGDKAMFVQEFCLPACATVDLTLMSPSETAIFLDKTGPLDRIGLAKGIAQPTVVRATMPAGLHRLFLEKKNDGKGLIFAMTGVESSDCRACQYQVSMLTDPFRQALCPGQRKTYAVKISNTGVSKMLFRLSPTRAGIAVNPASIVIDGGSEDVAEVTVMMPDNENQAQATSFGLSVEPECGKPYEYGFQVPFGTCRDCSLAGGNTLVRLPAMCPDDRAKIGIILDNGCQEDRQLRILSDNPEIEIQKDGFVAKTGIKTEISVGFKMPAHESSRFYSGSFKVVSDDGEVIPYDVYAPFKDDCCCDFEVELQTRFVTEQTMRPGDRFTYDYLVKNKCQSRKINFVTALGANVTKIEPESFILEPGASQPIQVAVEMPKKTADYADFVFAVRGDCGKQSNIAFKVRQAPVSSCCDYDVGIVTDLPQPFIMKPGARLVLDMGIKNRCKTVSLVALVTPLDNVESVEQTQITIPPGKLSTFRMQVKMPACAEGEKVKLRFRVAVDGCEVKEYSIPVSCGDPFTNCCDVLLTDYYGQLASLRLCPGEVKTITLALTNNCSDSDINGGTIYGDANLGIEPGIFSLKAGYSLKVFIDVRMPAEAKPGQDYTYTITVNVPGCQAKQFRFVVRCGDCGGSPALCCDFGVDIISGMPGCVAPGQSFELVLEIVNRCPNPMTIRVGGTHMVPQTANVSVAAFGRTRFKIKIQAPECKDQFRLEIFFTPVVPPECGEFAKKIDHYIRCCQ